MVVFVLVVLGCDGQFCDLLGWLVSIDRLSCSLDVQGEGVGSQGGVEGGVLAIGGATAVEALQADIESLGVVLGKRGSSASSSSSSSRRKGVHAYDGVEALGAVLTVDGLVGFGWREGCRQQSVHIYAPSPAPNCLTERFDVWTRHGGKGLLERKLKCVCEVPNTIVWCGLDRRQSGGGVRFSGGACKTSTRLHCT